MKSAAQDRPENIQSHCIDNRHNYINISKTANNLWKEFQEKKRWLALIEIIDEGMTSLFEVTAVATAGEYKLI